MKLTFKIVGWFMAGILVIVVFRGIQAAKEEIARFRADLNDDFNHTVLRSEEEIQSGWAKLGRASIEAWIAKVNRENHDFRIRRFEVLVATNVSRLDEPRMAEPMEPWSLLAHCLLNVHAPDESMGVVFRRIDFHDGRQAQLEIERQRDALYKETRHRVIQETVWLMAKILFVTTILAVVVGVRFVGRPLNKLIQKIRRISSGDLSGPVHLRTHDELEELAGCMNEMCNKVAESQDKLRQEAAARVAAVERLRHADRLHTVGQLAAGVAHELGTPLNVITGRAGLIASGKLPEGEVLESAATIKHQAEHMTTIIRQLMEFARRSHPQRSRADLGKTVGQAAGLLSTLAEKRNVSLSLELPDEPSFASVDVGQIQQVLTNLIVNAVHAMPDGGRVRIGIHRGHARPPEDHEAEAGPYYSIFVRDEGVGMNEETMEHIFEPFFTTKDVGEGTGLGLSIAYGIVQEHGGWIDVSSEPSKGSCFTVYLPEGDSPQPN